MAVLNKIRQRSLVLILVIALALFSFVVGDLFKNSDALTGGSQDVIATIEGTDINRNEFMQKVKSYQERFGGGQSSTQAMNAIYNQELRKVILDAEFEKLNLSVEKDEMRDLLKNSFSSYPEFQDDNGNFDVNRLNAFIANLKDVQPEVVQLSNFQVSYESWANNEQTIAANAVQQSYFNMIKAGVGTTIAEANDEYVGEAKTVDVRFVQIPYTSVVDSLVKVTKSEVQDYIKKNADNYKVDATSEIVYVEFKEEASKKDEDNNKAGLMALINDRVEYNDITEATDTILGFNTTTNVEDFINSNSDIKYNDAYLRVSELPAVAKDTLMNLEVGSYYGPYRDGEFFKLSKVIGIKQSADSSKVRHILIPYAGANRVDPTVSNSREEAKIKADSILTVLKANRSKFVDLLDLSSDKVSNESSGEIKMAYNSSFAPEFRAYGFDNEKGAIDVVETSFGFHIIEVLEQSNFSNSIKVATLADKIEPSEETLQDVFNKMSKFEIASRSGDFNTLAEERQLTAKPITFKELDETIPGLGSQREVVRWSFNEDTDTGDFKSFSVANFGFIVAKLVEKNEKGLMNVEDASITAIPEIKKDKKAKMIRDNLTGTTIDDIAKNQGLSVRTAAAITMNNTTLSGAGVEPEVIGAAFGLKVGAISKPINGAKGVYVLEVTKITEAPVLENYTSVINRLNSARNTTIQSKIYQALQKSADIEDNRAKTVY
ncbi:SurA N-terminal domain-containing protein [Winogradskyella sp. UBA3174]|uniref:SurA N-terminal domain-containing protein n=1 Tax=Winogradskyella sp. UBA3174 TaxID=1947785 RepID=UPI0025D477A6|nr:SurA N-terminal domain-containing protein [Winogradskyella sp. UBA3174]|tara:strand:+ start:12295 stop:14445 length:2151 start_codon:yes stop_codon:yes gene_type:complete